MPIYTCTTNNATLTADSKTDWPLRSRAFTRRSIMCPVPISTSFSTNCPPRALRRWHDGESNPRQRLGARRPSRRRNHPACHQCRRCRDPDNGRRPQTGARSHAEQPRRASPSKADESCPSQARNKPGSPATDVRAPTAGQRRIRYASVGGTKRNALCQRRIGIQDQITVGRVVQDRHPAAHSLSRASSAGGHCRSITAAILRRSHFSYGFDLGVILRLAHFGGQQSGAVCVHVG